MKLFMVKYSAHLEKRVPCYILGLLITLFANSIFAAGATEVDNTHQVFDGLTKGMVRYNDKLMIKSFTEKCSICHGDKMQGSGMGPALIGRELTHGDNPEDIGETIRVGISGTGMPAWGNTLSEDKIRQLSLYIAETRQTSKLKSTGKLDRPINMPAKPIKTERHSFVIETVAKGFHFRPFSIEPLPDGRILLTEKWHGLSVISNTGVQSPLIKGQPQVFSDVKKGLDEGIGWMYDVAIHPDYLSNGWVYLFYGDRCEGCNQRSRESGDAVSMNKLVRGRIRDGVWVDEQTIWEADKETYSASTDKTAGGRISFDQDGHIFFSVGMKGPGFYPGVQDLSLPYGKIYRLYTDGRIPKDNPFYSTPGALKAIWTYGHRSPQGLEFNHNTSQLWGTEQGPLGGDEINILIPGGNFGWPLYSKGLHYDGTPVDQGKVLGIEWKLEDIQQPVVDLTPSPAISSFIFYEGKEFPEWRGNILAGTLKSQELYRFVIKNNQVVHKETLFQGLGRIRDIEVGHDGTIYLLLENVTEGQIIRLVKKG